MNAREGAEFKAWSIAAVLCVVLPTALWPDVARAQERRSIANFTAGYVEITGEPIGYLALGGGVRRKLGTRVTVGPELLLMCRGGSCATAEIAAAGTSCAASADRATSLAGNVAFDLLAPASGDGGVVPYALAGAAALWQRRGDLRTWSAGFAMNIGAGVRARMSRTTSVGGEYRFGSRLRHRLTGFVGVHW